jgi:hypothetical protein
MPRKPPSPLHQWVGASTHPLDARAAAFANRHGRVRIDVDTVVDVLDVYCCACRRTYDDVADAVCVAAKSNEHLIGGPTGTRKRRVHDHDCALYGCVLTDAEAAALRQAAANPTGRHVG